MVLSGEGSDEIFAWYLYFPGLLMIKSSMKKQSEDWMAFTI